MWFGSARTLILRALVTIGFGVVLMAWPAISISVLILLFGAFALVDGGLIITTALQTRPGDPARAVALVAGALAVMVGIVTFLWPGLTVLALIVLIALRAVIIGMAELITASWIGRHSTTAWFLAMLGLVSIAFGALLLVYPAAGTLALVWAIGLYAVVVGCAGIARLWLLAASYA
jgi:uncharacterized membrane protein HdeD (DUF308 family)